MNVITLTVKPIGGNRLRKCLVCGDIYNGWNFIACQACEHEHQYIVIENWSK